MKPNATAQALNEISNLFSSLESNISKIVNKIVPSNNDIETVQPYWVNPTFQGIINFPVMYRFHQNKRRFYFSIDEQASEMGFRHDIVKFFASVTTIIDQTSPMPYGWKKLIGDLGLDGFYKMMRQKAHYGTLLHILFADYERSGNSNSTRFFDFDSLPSRIELFIQEKGIDFDTSDWGWSLKKDLLALIQFAWDFEIEPIAVEAIGKYDDGTFRFAGAIDLIAYMTIKEKGYWGEVYKSGERKGEPKETFREKRVIAIIDVKSGKSGFFSDHEKQLHMYKMMAEQSLGLEIERVFNVAPKDWENEPTYSLKDQTDSPEAKKIPFLLGLFYCEYSDPHDLQMISGKINGTHDMTTVLRTVPASEYLYNKVINNRY